MAAARTTRFIPYAPEIDDVSADFAEHLATVVAGVERYVASSTATQGTGRAVRFAHAKGYVLARAEVEIFDGLEPAYAQGIYARPARHDAVIRFSNGSAHPAADARLGNAFGLALKMFGTPGPVLLDDEPDTGTFDYNCINQPVFFCNTVAHYVFIHELFTDAEGYFARGKVGAHEFFTDYLTGKGTLPQKDWAWDELLAFLGMLKLPAVNPLLSTYWTMGAVRHGDFVAKVRFAPVRAFADAVEHRKVDRMSAPDAYRQALAAELKRRPYEFDIQVQLCTDLARMPVQDVTVEWLEELSPFVTVGKVRVPAQDVSGDDNLETMDALSFTPWRVTADHAPLGEIQRARKEVYRRSSIVRHQANGQARREPRSLSEVFGDAPAQQR